MSHTCVARPSPVRSPLFFWSPVEKVHLLGLMMSETPFHDLLQMATTSPGQGHVLMWFFSIYFWNPFPSSRRNQSKKATARLGGDAACVGHELHFRGSLRSISQASTLAPEWKPTLAKTHLPSLNSTFFEDRSSSKTDGIYEDKGWSQIIFIENDGVQDQEVHRELSNNSVVLLGIIPDVWLPGA